MPRRGVIALIGSLALVLAITSPPAGAGASGGRIAFLSDRSGTWALWAVDADGSALRRLTDARTRLSPVGPAIPYERDGVPSWSPDGTQLAFSAVRASPTTVTPAQREALFVVGQHGGPARKLTSPGGNGADVSPVWSPDGRMLAFMRFPDTFPALYSGWGEVWTFELATGRERRIGMGTMPSWSHDSQRLVLRSGSATTAPDGSRHSGYTTAAPDGSAPAMVPLPPGWNREPSWSPTARRLAFIHTPDSPADHDRHPRILLVNEDGTNARVLDAGDAGQQMTGPQWSPDGRELAYTATDEDGPTELRVRAAEDGEPRVVARFDHEYTYLSDVAWSPDGRTLSMSELVDDEGADDLLRPDYTAALIAVPSDGLSWRRLVHDRNRVSAHPAWRPDPSIAARRAEETRRAVQRIRAAERRRAAQQRRAAQRRRAAARRRAAERRRAADRRRASGRERR